MRSLCCHSPGNTEFFLLETFQREDGAGGSARRRGDWNEEERHRGRSCKNNLERKQVGWAAGAGVGDRKEAEDTAVPILTS